MKKRNIYLFILIILLGIFILFRPDLFIREIFNSKRTSKIPEKYEPHIPADFISHHVYTIAYSESPPVSFFRNDTIDFITVQYDCYSEMDIAYSKNGIENLNNKFSGAFEFKNSLVRYFNRNIENEKIKVIRFNGDYTISINNEKINCTYFTGDFEILINNKKIVSYKTLDKSCVILKKDQSVIQLYIVDSDNKEVINQFLLQ